MIIMFLFNLNYCSFYRLQDILLGCHSELGNLQTRAPVIFFFLHNWITCTSIQCLPTRRFTYKMIRINRIVMRRLVYNFVKSDCFYKNTDDLNSNMIYICSYLYPNGIFWYLMHALNDDLGFYLVSCFTDWAEDCFLCFIFFFVPKKHFSLFMKQRVVIIGWSNSLHKVQCRSNYSS